MSFSNSGWCMVQRGVLTQQLTHHVHSWGATWCQAFQLQTKAGLQRCALTLQAPPGYACSLDTVLCKEATTLRGESVSNSTALAGALPPHQQCREYTPCYLQQLGSAQFSALQPGSASSCHVLGATSTSPQLAARAACESRV